MTGLISLFVGLLLGGCTTGLVFCCLQISRINDYKNEIRNLKKKLNAKE